MNITETEISKTPSAFAQRLLDWYSLNARSMPWRVPPAEHGLGVRADPYRIWLSEVMLQQTQVATVIDYYIRFVEQWPSIRDLAAAELDDVLKAWAGLGYYSRARNLKKCADLIVKNHNGRFPENYDELRQLPGIGDYTASAIASIAFGEAVAVIDGNVERVISRHKMIVTPFPAAKSQVRKYLEEMLEPENPGEFAQAMMDLGATVCSPRRPTCAFCPVSGDCIARAQGNPEQYPVKMKKSIKPTRKGAAYIIQNDRGEVFLCKREEKGLLAGMAQVPTTQWNSQEDGATGFEAAPLKADWQFEGTVRHTFTHFHLELEVWTVSNTNHPALEGWWCAPKNLNNEALPSVMLKVLNLKDKI
ncbi:MAG: A/G-specific adenine glycosylase [Rhizobiaceae bacterium]